MALNVNRIAKVSAWGAGVVFVGGVAGLLGVLSVVYALVYFGDDSNLKKTAIMAQTNRETMIYMLDGETQIGSIFDTAHRRYVPIDEVPAHMINALIAAEDKNFYSHHGIDPGAIFAAGLGYLSGHRMRGASTLTQQTARNILGWWEVSLSRKFREWIAALQLERLYSKRQILEFYLNQFYVSGNGNGIGIAARYYFNKDVRDLDLIESAFIAGSVKGPSQYDPFIKFTKERRERAIKLAYHRKNYVLRRMYEQGWITEEQFKDSWEKPVKFNRGKFTSEEVALVHLIRQQLKRKEILEGLGIEDPRELSAAGLKIYTTIDQEMQQAGQLAVRRNLSRLETILSGYKEEKPELWQKRRNLTVNDFFFGQVTEFGGTPKEPTIKLNFGLPNCEIPYESIMRYAKWLDLPYYRGWQAQAKDLLKKLKVGDVLYVEIKEYDNESHSGVCELMKRPRVNGGLIALDKGEVRAVVSGFDTKGFNRAMQAKRQPGSVFKPVVYFAALQLGWSILDRLDNERQIFPFQGRFYYPRPDHDSPYKDVSMLWAGIMSENVGSVSLTAHLVDKLNFDQFKQLMGVLDLLPHPGEAPRDFHFRVARAMGVTLDNEGVREFQLTNAINDLILDVQYTSTYEFQQKLRKMWWGRGYAAEMQTVALADDDASPGQKAIKLKLAGNNFLRMQALDAAMTADWQTIEAVVTAKGADEAFLDPVVQKTLSRFRVLPGLSKPALGYVVSLEGEQPSKAYKNKAEIDKIVSPSGRPLNNLDMQAIWGGSALFGSADISLNDVLLDGWLPHAHEHQLAQYVDKHYDEIMSRQEDYDLNRYYQHHDFRIAVGLNYLVQLAHAMGVTSKVEPVLSFPLGTNVVSLAEVAKIYQTFVSGKTYRFYQEGPPNQINLIKKIEDRFGNPIFEPKRQEFQLVMPEFGMQMREILQRVVTHGTGRKARAELYLTLGGEPSSDPAKKASPEKRIRIPAFGKTGTTNDYTNANFAGFMPYPTEKGAPLDPENSYVIAAYTGYDLAKQMVRGAVKVSGSFGALPAWIGLAKEIIDKKKFGEQVDALDLSMIAKQEWPLKRDPRATPLTVDMPRGVILGGGGGVDQEAIEMSNSAKDGETALDEFRANVVQTTIRMPLDAGGAPLRLFSPYKMDDQVKGDSQVRSTIVPSSPVSTPASAKASSPVAATPPVPKPIPEPNMDDNRGYDSQGNRKDGQVQAAPAGAGAASAAKQPDDLDARTSAQPTAPKGAVVDPMDMLKDIGNPDDGQPADDNDEEGGGGFQEEELW